MKLFNSWLNLIIAMGLFFFVFGLTVIIIGAIYLIDGEILGVYAISGGLVVWIMSLISTILGCYWKNKDKNKIDKL